MDDLEIRIKVSKDGKRLETSAGTVLYYFEPQLHDPFHDKIPFMGAWDSYIQPWIMK